MKRILIVEDEVPIRRLLRSILDGNGYQTIEASGVVEAQKALASREVDVVLTVETRAPAGSAGPGHRLMRRTGTRGLSAPAAPRSPGRRPRTR